LGSIELNYSKLKQISHFVQLSDLNLELSIGLALCFCSFDGAAARLDSMYVDCIHFLRRTVTDPQLTGNIIRTVRELLELLEPSYSSKLKDSLAEILEKTTKNLFMDYVSIPIAEFVFDQIFLYSSESCDDPTMPSILKWLSWISFVMILMYGENEAAFFTMLHKVTIEELSLKLEQYFIRTKREQLIYEARIPPVTSYFNDDEVVEISIKDFSYPQIPTYYQELQVWKRKQRLTMKQNVMLNIAKWRHMAKLCIHWISFVNGIKKKMRSKPRTVHYVEQKKEERKVVIVEERPEKKIHKEPSATLKHAPKKNLKDLAFEMTESGDVRLNSFGELFETIIDSTRMIFVDPPLPKLHQTDLLEMMLPTPTTSQSNINTKDELFVAVFDSFDTGNLS
jgi:hypothetical protein